MAKKVYTERPKDLRKTLKDFGGYLGRHKCMLLLICLLAVVSALANVVGTYLFKPIIDDYILPGNLLGLLHMVLLMAVLYIIGVLASYGYSQMMVRVAQQMVQELRQDLFDKVQRLPLAFYDAHTHGELMSRFTNDMETITEALNNSFTVVVQNAVIIVGTFAVLLLLNWRLSLIVFACFAAMAVFLWYSSKRSHAYFTSQQKAMGDLNGFVEEMVEGQKVVQVFHHEAENFRQFEKQNRNLQQAADGAIMYSGLLVPVVVSISYLNYAISAFVGALFAISGQLGLGALTSYLVYVRQTAMPINQFSLQLNFILAALSGAERIFAVLHQPEEVDTGTVRLVRTRTAPDGHLQETAEHTGQWAWSCPQADGSSKLVPLRGDVRFRQVQFGYVPGHPILKGIDLYAKPGQKIAFVGSTGAGKTTIANLINRFYEIQGGRIVYDGIDLRDIRKADLRRSVAVVLQDTHLFTGTIAENICYGNASATRKQMIDAAKLAGADSFITRLPNGYDTVITDDGGNLSQGQRQLLSIARAAVMDPPVLILDEATSSVDTHTEKQIERGMDRLMEGRTVFVIAHRLSTVRNAKAILVLEQGRVLERGSHEELVAQKGRYYQLYTGQFELS